MRIPSRLLGRALLASIPLLLGIGDSAQAQDGHAHMDMPAQGPATPVERSRWSDPASWPGGKVPAAGDAVTIARDREILLDVTPPALRSITVQGKLTFADERDLDLVTDWIYVPGGEVQIGTEASPFQHHATITLTDAVPGEDINTMGDRGIMLLRGTLNMHGNRDHSWTKLSSTAAVGATSITVLDA
ncbi:MAG: G8 domain-containing protein, partial [Pseudoxanthomonas sp.]